MNKARRQAIDKIQATIEEAMNGLQVLLEEEQEYFDNMPESLQESERANSAQEAIDTIEDATSNIQEAIDSLSAI